jgi:hypothetical protein
MKAEGRSGAKAGAPAERREPKPVLPKAMILNLIERRIITFLWNLQAFFQRKRIRLRRGFRRR